MSTIAILMSTFNGERFIDKQLQSIANQKTSCDIVLYIRDDGSTDSTIDIIQKWKKHIRIELNQGINCGPALSFWELLKSNTIQADYFAFCDQDDIWDDDKLETAIESLKKGYDLYCCNCRIINCNDQIIENRRREIAPTFTYQELFISGVTQGCAMVFSNRLRNFIFNSNISVIPMHDLIMLIYGKTYGRVFWDDSPHFSYRFHQANVVANEKAKSIRVLQKKIKRWKNGKYNSMSLVAKELLENFNITSMDEEEYLNNIRNYKKSIKSKLKLLMMTKCYSHSNGANRSYKIRILLNLY